ncbi:MAG: aminodeoxychorismate/anthranilate synthase component II [Barnesiella sp.]|nr:aminodeoxychorismate/anthranilate synthase component II [Barnesiella sp.]MBD5258364.1 aminodeoxychorismate/anthranilate synthase component II [Barnesiella sp.]
MKILIIDNYDSFTYNIVDALRTLGTVPDVVRNDRLDLDAIEDYDKIIISPGPGIPSEAGQLPQFLERYATRKPILGICLGHQALGEYFGARLRNLSEVYHGVSSPVEIVADDYMFEGIDSGTQVGRYHSWVVDSEGLPESLEVTATSADGAIMAMRHRDYDVRGLQFHPESIMTPQGARMLDNWLRH